MNRKHYALILLAGNSLRFSTNESKQLVLVNNRPLFTYSLNTFINNPNIDGVFLVVKKEEKETIEKWCNGLPIKGFIIGGKTRQESVKNGLAAIKNSGITDDDIILIHDGDRPLVSEEIINDSIKASEEHPAISVALKINDTLVMANKNKIDEYIDREHAYQLQTPQTFQFKLIYEGHMHQSLNEKVTDDTKIVCSPIYLIDGDPLNFKITNQKDFELFKKIVGKK